MKITICKNNRTFEAHITPIGSSLAEVAFYEVVRPSWKIFRTTFFSFHTSSFWVEDYSSIIDAIQACLNKGFENEFHEKETTEKWKNFQKTIDKYPKV